MSRAPSLSSASAAPSGPGSSRPRTPVDASPPARRASRPGWRDPRFAIGLVLVALSVVVGVRVVEGRDDTTPVLVAARPLVAGQRLGPDDVTAAEVRFTAAGDADRYLPAPASWADTGWEGSVVTRAVGTGELVPRAATSPSLAPDVQVPLAVPLGRVPSTVQVGSTVDVWATPEAGSVGSEPVEPGAVEGAQRLLRGVPVLSVSRGQGLGPDSEIQVVVGVADQRGAVADVVRTVAGSGVLLVHRPEGELTVARVTVAIAAGTAGWESAALEAVASAPGRLTLVKRCLDLSDLLAVAATGTLRVVLLSTHLDGLDTDSVERLRRAGVRSAVVVPSGCPEAERRRLRRLGLTRLVDETELAGLVSLLEEAAAAELAPPGVADLLPSSDRTDDRTGADVVGAGADAGADARSAGPAPDAPGRVVAVWGPHGAPGRTTVAIGLAAEAAAQGVPTTLVDADPHGAAVGQHLAVLDEASGLLAAVRLANAGQLDAARLVTVARQLDDRLRLVTGLPRPDRWTEVRPATLTTVLDVAATLTPLVVVDAGFGLDTRAVEGRPAVPSRERLGMAVLEHADDLVVVASADPVGLARLARALLDLRGVRPSGPDLVVVNRMRPGLGWAERDVVDMVARVAPDAHVAFLPDDRSAADRALVGGRTLREGGDGPLRRAMAHVAAGHLARVGLAPPGSAVRGRRGRRAGRGLGRRRGLGRGSAPSLTR